MSFCCTSLKHLTLVSFRREYAQKLRHYMAKIDDAGIGVVGVSLGTVDAAKDFCAETGFPLDNMFMVSFPRPIGRGETVHSDQLTCEFHNYEV